MPNDYDQSKDKMLSEVKVRNDKTGHGYHFRVMSYDGREPKLAVEHYYREKDGKTWRKDAKTKYPRMAFALVHALIENTATFDRGMRAWKDSGEGKRDSAPDDPPF